MKRPSERELIAFYQAQPPGLYTCSGCGRTAEKAYVQPQHPYYAGGQVGVARCGNCIGKANLGRLEATAAERKAGKLKDKGRVLEAIDAVSRKIPT